MVPPRPRPTTTTTSSRVLRGGFTRVEQTLLDGDRGAAVIQQRMAFQEVMRERFEAVIQHATGRAVIGFMSGNQQDPDMICEVFVLSPTDLATNPRSSQPIDPPSRLTSRGRACQAPPACSFEGPTLRP